MAHLHVHTLPGGKETSAAVIDPDNENLHWHTVDGERTSIDAFGAGHTHTFEGSVTSGPIDRDEKGSDMTIENKQIGGNVVEVKQIERNGVPIGTIAGYISTWDIDRGSWGLKDRFIRGAFLESIADHRSKNRQVRFKDHHGRTVGGFPIETVREDERGLFGIAEINLDVQQGKEAFALAKQGVLTDFSIGFTSLEDTESNIDGDRVRSITKAIIWEGSIVDEPANQSANITEVKSAVPFQDLPLASRDRDWNSEEALIRVKEFTEEGGDSDYRKAFVIHDGSEHGLKLLVADVVDGKLTIIPKAVLAAAEEIKASSEISRDDKPHAIKHVEKYFAKMGLDSPFGDDVKQFYVGDDVKEWTERDIEKFLKSTGSMSKSAAKFLASKLDVKKKQQNDDDANALIALMNELKSFKKQVSK